jgi:ABC-type protease/lipase transport system fused ATPase/permease subunit
MAGIASVWFGLVLVPRIFGIPSVSGIGRLTERVWELTNPENQDDFIANYCSIFRDLYKLALYRAGQALVGFVPFLLLYLIACQLFEEQNTFFVGATFSSIVALAAIWLFPRNKRSTNAD